MIKHGDYKSVVLAVSDIWEVKRVADKRKKNRIFNYRATQESENTEELHSWCSLTDSTSEKKQTAFKVWLEDIIQLQHSTCWSNTSLKRILFLKQQAHCSAAPELYCVSCGFLPLYVEQRSICMKSFQCSNTLHSFLFFMFKPIISLITSVTFTFLTQSCFGYLDSSCCWP